MELAFFLIILKKIYTLGRNTQNTSMFYLGIMILVGVLIITSLVIWTKFGKKK